MQSHIPSSWKDVKIENTPIDDIKLDVEKRKRKRNNTGKNPSTVLSGTAAHKHHKTGERAQNHTVRRRGRLHEATPVQQTALRARNPLGRNPPLCLTRFLCSKGCSSRHDWHTSCLLPTCSACMR